MFHKKVKGMNECDDIGYETFVMMREMEIAMDKNMVQTVIDEIGEISELLYQENFSEGYTKLAQLLKQMSVMTADLTDEETQAEFVGILRPAMEALEVRDATLLADILQYDLKEKLEEYL